MSKVWDIGQNSIDSRTYDHLNPNRSCFQYPYTAKRNSFKLSIDAAENHPELLFDRVSSFYSENAHGVFEVRLWF